MYKSTKLSFIILIIACNGRDLFADGSESKPLQLAIENPYQLVPAEMDIHGLRLNFIYGKNRNVKGIDLGLVNKVDGNLSGFQAGLIFNGVDGNLSGLQAGLIFNGVDGIFSGLQAGLVVNAAKNVRGGQIACYNFSENVRGFQLAIANGSTTVKGVQLGLVSNTSPAFFDDYTQPWSVEEVSGMQIALLNCCKKMTGAQIGFYNWCNEMRGIQIGIINIINEGPIRMFPILNASF